MNTTNLNRDPIRTIDDVWVKRAALAAAEANACGTESELALRETELRVGLMSRGYITLDEYDKLSHFDYDGLPDDETGEHYHHVYFYARGEAAPLLDITCNL